MFPINKENLKKLKYNTFLETHQVFLLFTVVVINMKKYLKKRNQLKY